MDNVQKLIFRAMVTLFVLEIVLATMFHFNTIPILDIITLLLCWIIPVIIIRLVVKKLKNNSFI